MTVAEAPAPQAPQEPKRGFSLPSAYTILFALIILVAIATWIIPAGQYDLDENGQPVPGSSSNGPATRSIAVSPRFSAAQPTRQRSFCNPLGVSPSRETPTDASC